MAITVWMNHWFSTAVNIIDLLRANGFRIYVIGTNENKYSVIKNSCDEWYQEPVLKDEDYVEYCLDFCKVHNVQVFLPRRGMIKISENKRRFEDMGVKVMLEDYDIMKVLNNKAEAYAFYSKNSLGPVPDYYLVTTSAQFLEAYNLLLTKYAQVCFKFARDEGGKSFRLIDSQRKGYTALLKKQNTRMTLDDVMEALSEREIFDPIMIMPFLPDEEISVDCLNTEQELIALPRVKGYGKYEILCYDDEIMRLCKSFQDKVSLSWPYNIQFKYLNGIPYFLEVNTRMSGGVHMSCFASGVNIPQLALKKLLGDTVEWNNSFKTKMVAQVLNPVTID